ncbi:MAG: response regulator [Bdellovibrio sp.]
MRSLLSSYTGDLSQEDMAPVTNPDFAPKVLLVEDSPSTMLALTNAFLGLGCTSDMAFEANEACSLFMIRKYDLLVLDWNLPDLTGGEFLERMDLLIKHSKQTPHSPIPVVIHTAKDWRGLQYADCHFFKVIDYWKKPMGFSEVSLHANQTIHNLF